MLVLLLMILILYTPPYNEYPISLCRPPQSDILCYQYLLAQDKGGPSKGGFLNNISFSYTDLYLCHGINGVCI